MKKMNNLLTRYLLEAAGEAPMQAPLAPNANNKKEPKMNISGVDPSVEPQDQPPDLTQNTEPAQQNGPEQPPADPGQDPSMGGDVPPEGDPNADPNAQEDPNADPNAMGQDPNAMQPQTPEDQIDQDEKEVFSDLKPEQMLIKKNELREQYKELYNVIVDSLDKINKISHTTYDDTMLDFIVKKLAAMRSEIRDTLIDTFATRTYVDNKIELQRFIVNFNRITNMLTEIYKSRLKRQEKVAALNKSTLLHKDREEFPIFQRGYDM